MATATASVTAPAMHAARRVTDAVEQVVLGKRAEIELVVAGLLAGGHVLLEDVPGVGKTLLAKALARAVGGTFGRVQGTADLLPADITGVSVYDRSRDAWIFHPGPIFHNVVLIDEINRATPRAQSALLEAMAEGQVTVDGTVHPLPAPFFVIATQNPYGDVGTFPLVEGQCDRFALVVSLGLPDREAERAIVRGQGGIGALDQLETAAITARELLDAVQEADRLHLSDAVADYALDIVDATRSRPGLAHGASTRAARTLVQVAKARAALHGRRYVAPDDVKAVAGPVLGHRLGTVAGRDAAGGQQLVADVIQRVPAPTV